MAKNSVCVRVDEDVLKAARDYIYRTKGSIQGLGDLISDALRYYLQEKLKLDSVGGRAEGVEAGKGSIEDNLQRIRNRWRNVCEVLQNLVGLQIESDIQIPRKYLINAIRIVCGTSYWTVRSWLMTFQQLGFYDIVDRNTIQIKKV